jgi:hypothetical protein
LATSYWNTRLAWVGADLTVERRVPLGWPTLRLAGGIIAEYASQTLRRQDAAELAGTPYPSGASGSSVLAGARGIAGLRMPITSRAWIDLDARCDLLAASVAGSPAALVRPSAKIAAGWAFP